MRKIIQDLKKGQNMYSEPSWGPCFGQGLLKWTEIGLTNDPCMIWDEFETFCNDRFCKLKPEYIFKRIIHFLESRIFIPNKYSFFKKSRIFIKKIISLKSRMFIQKNIDLLYIHSKKHSFFLKDAASPTSHIHSFFPRKL